MRRWLLKLLRVPPEPAVPPGSQGSVKVFRAARNYYRLLLLQWGLKQLSAVIGIIVSLTFLKSVSHDWSETARFWVNVVEWMGVASFVAQIPFTFLMVQLDYELRWYIVTDRSLRIRAGLWNVREMTMTFANIQHLAVHQGPLQRLLGIYDLQVRTAGGGGMEEHSQQRGFKSALTHIGHFHGVDNAPAIRDLIVERMKRVRDAGLGDTDDTPAHEADVEPPPSGIESFHSAVKDLRAEITALREALQ